MASHAYSIPASTSDGFRRTLLKMRRQALEDWIDRAIALLDSLDGDPDHEEGADAEMSLGWQSEGGQLCLRASLDDREGSFA